MGYYVYFYLGGSFSDDVDISLDSVKVQVYLNDELIKTHSETITYTNVNETVANDT